MTEYIVKKQIIEPLYTKVPDSYTFQEILTMPNTYKEIDMPNGPFSHFTMQITLEGKIFLWNVYLEGSIDNENYDSKKPIICHSQSDGNRTIKSKEFKPLHKIRIYVATLLGEGRLHCTIVAMK